ncbi:hypothetical protein KFE25_001410 [Diacronema lutheri]|uniref:Protein kinase domain-containing protein n=1 Tax=Diacronema lutheri TaxID=2081491 RepID=A0A8J5XII9_DIALT|nr:hypothetical protein KFE25_001410 [Diacronema lutheri]
MEVGAIGALRRGEADGGHAFLPAVRERGAATDGWWPLARAACNPAARLSAGLRLLDAERRLRGGARGSRPPAASRRLPHDADGHVRCEQGMPLFAGRFRFMRPLAAGATARTIVCEDLFRPRDDDALMRAARAGEGAAASAHACVVLKVYGAAHFAIGEQESERLRRLNAADPLGVQRVVRQLGRFVLDGAYFVLVLPLLCPLPPPPAAPMALARVRSLAACALLGAAFVHATGLVHADLKPDNLMLELPPPPDGAGAGVGAGWWCGAPYERCTLIDFASACTPAEAAACCADGELVTLRYRPPELLYGRTAAPVSTAIDIWSLACALFELACGEPLFAARSVAQLALQIGALLGRPPPSYDRAARAALLARAVSGCEPTRPRAAVVLALCRRLLRGGHSRRAACELAQLSDLLASMLAYEPDERPSARAALLSPFVAALLPFGALAPFGGIADGLPAQQPASAPPPCAPGCAEGAMRAHAPAAERNPRGAGAGGELNEERASARGAKRARADEGDGAAAVVEPHSARGAALEYGAAAAAATAGAACRARSAGRSERGNGGVESADGVAARSEADASGSNCEARARGARQGLTGAQTQRPAAAQRGDELGALGRGDEPGHARRTSGRARVPLGEFWRVLPLLPAVPNGVAGVNGTAGAAGAAGAAGGRRVRSVAESDDDGGA